MNEPAYPIGSSLFLGATALALGLLAACASQDARPPFSLRELSGSSLNAVPAVARFELSGRTVPHSSELLLVQGEVSSVQQTKIRHGEVSESITRRRQHMAVWSEGNSLILSPSLQLKPGDDYSLLALGSGLLAEFQVAEDEVVPLTRLGQGPVRIGQRLVYCPANSAQSNASSSDCAQVRVLDRGGFFVPPANIIGEWVEPIPQLISSDPPALEGHALAQDSSSCVGGALFHGGCASVEGATLLFQFEPGAGLIRWRSGSRNWESFSHSSVDVVSNRVGPLEPLSRVQIEINWVSFDGLLEAEVLELTSGEAAGRVLISEVMSNPRGSEPQGEWVELLNVGNGPAALAGYEIWDESGGSPLPAVSLMPGQFGLIVRADFEVDETLLPAADALALVVQSIGGNGLRNSGEEVILRDPQGVEVSRLFAFESAEGQSTARPSLWSAQQSTEACEHAAPGSSPGRSNECEGP